MRPALRSRYNAGQRPMDRILVISYFANVDSLAPSHHIDDRLAHMADRSDVVLLSSPCGERSSHASVHARVPSPAPSGIRYETRHILRRLCQGETSRKLLSALVLIPLLPLYLLEKIILKLDSTWSWFLTASVAATVLAARHRPRAIYSTGGPVCAHLAAMIASRATGVPYVAEFQDSVVNRFAAPGWLERRFMEWVEKKVFHTAERVVFLTRKAAENAEARHGRGKAACIYAGGEPLPGARAKRERGPALRVAHFGSLGGSRNLDCFLDALEGLVQERPGAGEKIAVELYGHSDRRVQRRIEESAARGAAVFAKGKVKRTASLGLMGEADLLLLIQNADVVASESIPSKTYEYLLSGRPVLALTYRNPELRAMLEEYGHTVCEADDRGAVRAALDSALARWEKGALETGQAKSRYTVKAAVQELFALLPGPGRAREVEARPRPAGNARP